MEHGSPTRSSVFPGLLKRLRVAAGVTQEQLAERAGLSVRGISDLERGRKRQPHPSTVALLADALQLTPSERAEFVAAIGRPGLAWGPGILSGPQAPNIARPPTPLIGREYEIETLRVMLEKPTVRLLSLVGPGGVGKTRLAVAVAEILSNGGTLRACFVDLSPVTVPSLVVPSIAAALDVRDGGGPKLLARVIDAVRDRSILLILDNFEQVLEAAAVVGRLLADCPTLKVLVTSRTPLRLRWEHEFPVAPLMVPDPRQVRSPDDVLASPAVTLFVERARAVRPRFALSDRDAFVVAEICACLDGLPLALELAAARVKVFPVVSLLACLQQDLALLCRTMPDAPARHHTLVATLDWSYRLLSNVEQKVFRRLAVFVGGWDLEAAVAICRDAPGGIPILEVVYRLVDWSLIVATPHDGEVRFRFLETTRHFAGQRLEESGELAAVRDRHLEWYVRLAQRAEPELLGANQATWMTRLERDRGNVRVALAWGIESGREQGLALASSLWRFWRFYGDHAEGLRWLDTALALPTPSSPNLEIARGWALVGSGVLLAEQGSPARSGDALRAGLALFRRQEHQPGVAQGLRELGKGILVPGVDLAEAQQVLEESLAVARQSGDNRAIGWALVHLGHLPDWRGDHRGARTLYEEGLRLFREIGDTFSIAGTLWLLTWLAVMSDERDEAQRRLEACLSGFSDLAYNQGIAGTLPAKAWLAWLEDGPAAARPFLEESIALFRETGGVGLDDVARIVGDFAARRHQYLRAAHLFASGHYVGPQSGTLLALRRPRFLLEWHASMARVKSELGPEAFDRAWEEGSATSVEQAVANALENVAANARIRCLVTDRRSRD